VSYAVVFRPGARRDLHALPRAVQERVAAEIAALAANPRDPGTKRLSGVLSGLRRTRVGDYRIAYAIEEEEKRIRIWAIGHRRDFYRAILRHL
jgi:mRNA interferase RelE/StbE